MAEPITRNAYAILGVDPDSDDKAILAAYRAMARRLHPDVAGDVATVRMMRLNEAFQRVRTPERRAEYDLELERSGIPGPRRASRVAQPASAASPAPAGDASAARAIWRQERDGTGGAGPPPGHPSGSVLGFGRHIGWSLGEIARVDRGYLVWLEGRPEGRPYLEEIDRMLRASGGRAGPSPSPDRMGRRRG